MAGRKLSIPGFGPSYANDWLTGEKTSNPVLQEGKWWDGYHYEHTRRDRVSDQRRVQRNKAAKRFLASQSNDWQ